MSYGGNPFGGPGGYGGNDVTDIPASDTRTHLAVEVAFTTGALETPVWVDVTPYVRSWSTARGRRRELERFQPGRATVVLSNRDGRFDSRHTSGPYYGNLKPMRRIRIRETFNGVTYPVFDGYVDKWQLDYPNVGKDATATVTATDGFKILARTDLPKSVYDLEVEADSPDLWWPLDDPQYLFEALDRSANGNNGTPTGNVSWQLPPLIVNDPGGSVGFDEATGVGIATDSFSFDAAEPFAFEFWFKWEEQPSTTSNLAEFTSAGGGFVEFSINPASNKGFLTWRRDDATTFGGDPDFTFVVGDRYHIVCVHGSDRVLRVYINGTEPAYDNQDTTSGALSIVTAGVGTATANTNRALVDEFAVYTTTVLSEERIAAHYAAGTAPWQDDLPGARIERILDIVGWPDDLREIDTGLTTLQSATLRNS